MRFISKTFVFVLSGICCTGVFANSEADPIIAVRGEAKGVIVIPQGREHALSLNRAVFVEQDATLEKKEQESVIQNKEETALMKSAEKSLQTSVAQETTEEDVKQEAADQSYTFTAKPLPERREAEKNQEPVQVQDSILASANDFTDDECGEEYEIDGVKYTTPQRIGGGCYPNPVTEPK